MREEWIALRSGTDIRGDAIAREGFPATLTQEAARAIGAAFVAWLRAQGDCAQRPTIALGRDSRLSGEVLCEAFSQGLTHAGAKVISCGLCTTPAMFMTTVTEGFCCDGAVMCTASHHPWYRNGFKFFTPKGGLVGKDIAWILENAQDIPACQSEVETRDFLSVYAAQLGMKVREGLQTQAEKPLSGLHVVVDAGNGAGGFYARLMEDLGANVSGSRYLEPDGHFPNHIPNPEDKTAMASICEAVRESGADVGVIFDTDCDRAAVVDSKGNEINRNRLIALIARILLEEQKGITVVTDSVTSTGLTDFIAAHGGTHYRYKRGYRNVIDEALRLNAEGANCPLAIETSGHAAMRENYFLDDGMYLATRLIVAAKQKKEQGGDLGDWIADLHEAVEAEEIRLDITKKDFRTAGEAAIAAFESAALSAQDMDIAPDNREGMRVFFTLEGKKNAGWILVRLSVHDPVLPINIESDVPGGARQMTQRLAGILESVDGLDLQPLFKAAQQ